MSTFSIKKLAISLSLSAGIIAGAQAGTTATADANANTKTKAIFSWIADLPNRGDTRILTGAFGGYSGNGYSETELTGPYTNYGKYPAIYSCDYGHGWAYYASGQEANTIDYSCNSSMITHWNNGGLVSISHHMGNPMYAGNNVSCTPNVGDCDSTGHKGGYKTQISTADMQSILQSGTAARTRWLAMLDKIATGLAELQTNGVTVIYRPLHEINGDWFWWGITDKVNYNQARVDAIRALYNDIFTYFTNTKGLHNLIWVYNVDQSAPWHASFAPNNYDMSSLDAYVDNVSSIAGYTALVGLGRPFAIGEIGPSTTNHTFNYGTMIDTVKSNFPKATYILSWNGDWSPLANTNGTAWYNSSWSINRGQVWANQGTGVLTSTITDLAQGKSVSATSFDTAGHEATNAVDGNGSTRWSSAYTDSQSITVDLGAVSMITSVKLSWEAAYGKSYQIQLSNDNSSWTTAYSQTNGAGGVETISLAASARYVRMQGVSRGTTYGYSLWSFQVFGSEITPPTNLIANPGFEADGAATQTPASWGTWVGAGTAAADYTEANVVHGGTYNLAHWSGTATFTVSTYQTVNNLANGTYLLTAWVRSNAGHTAKYMNVKNYGGAELQANIPTASSYTQISLYVPVTNATSGSNGHLDMSFFSQTSATGQWINVDDVSLVRVY